MRQEIERANDLMAQGQNAKAKALLEGILKQQPAKKRAWADAASIYLMGGMYDEVKRLFAEYKSKTGKDLDAHGGTDFSLEDVEKEIQKQQSSVPGQFKAIPLLRRYHGAAKFNYWRTHGITDINLLSNQLIIVRDGQHYTFSWNEVTAHVLTYYLGGRNDGNVLVNAVTLQARGQVFTFKVIPALADANPRFEREAELIPSLKRYVNVTVTHKKQLPWSRAVAVILIALLVIIRMVH